MFRKIKKNLLIITMLCFVVLSLFGCDFSTQKDNLGPTYEVVFKDYDGTILQEIEVLEGKTAVYTGNELVREGYTFAGWNVDLSKIEQDTIAIAQYNPVVSNPEGTDGITDKQQFAVTFRNYDGTILQTILVDEGDTAKYSGTIPTKVNEGFIYYNFKNWDKSLENVVSNMDVYAEFEAVDMTPTYTVIFKNYDGSELETVTVKYGEDAIYSGDAPTKPTQNHLSYKFSGWDMPTTNVTKNLVVFAKYVEYDNRLDIRVSFENYDGTVLYSKVVKEGEEVEYIGPTPTKPSYGFTKYEFVEWKLEENNETKNITYVAVFEEVDETPSYTVTFVNYDDSVLGTVTITHGSRAEYTGSIPQKPSNGFISYEFKHWDKSLENVTSDLVVKALFEEIDNTPSYTVTFKNYDGSVLDTVTVKQGYSACYKLNAPTKPNNGYIGYTFSGWDKETNNVISDLEVFAQFTEYDTRANITVTFKNYDNSVLDVVVIKSGENVSYDGEEPTRETEGFISYSFKGWDKSLENITSNTIITAVYDVIDETPEYEVVFKNYNNDVLTTVKVRHGSNAIYAYETPVRPTEGFISYTFKGWDKSLENITSDLEITALYDVIDETPEYTVLFKNYDGSLLQTVTVRHGENVTYTGEMPTKEDNGFISYEFDGWDKSLENITSGLEITAVFKEVDNTPSYTVTFKNHDGEVLETLTVRHGSSATYTGETPVKEETESYSYEFIGWDKSLENITGELEVTAQFKEIEISREYTVVFKNYNGEVLETVTVKEGEAATYTGSTPKKPMNGNLRYEFSTWDKEFDNVTSDLEVVALFSSSTIADLSYRAERDFSGVSVPSNKTNEDQLPLIDESLSQYAFKEGNVYSLVSGNVRLDFIINGEIYVTRLVNISGIDKKTAVEADSEKIMFTNATPVIVYMESSDALNTGYSLIETTTYGIRASASLTTTNGSTVYVMDCYYFPQEGETGVFNVRRTVKIEELNAADTGFASEYMMTSANTNELEWFVPNNVFRTPTAGTKTYKETYLGIPMMMMRQKDTGYTLSLSRYQPIVSYIDNQFASLKYDNSAKNITISYPYKGYYHTAKADAQHVYDLSIRAEVTENYNVASSNTYNAHFNLQNQRIVATDIDEVYNVITEDFETFLHKTEQVKLSTGSKYYAYGLPWRITIEDGEFGPLTYQAGFVGQQIPAAYNMILHGLMTDDVESLQNGINVINFWVNDAEFMSGTVVPRIWYDTTGGPNGEGQFRSYPTFLRMAVDAMEGLLDAYLVLSQHGIFMDTWYDALEKFGKFLTIYQNEDGSYYRCYNLDGGPFVDGDNGIEEPDKDRNICQSESKVNTPMAVRILGKFYELTGEEKYKKAALKAGEFIYNELYPRGNYQGGTCDNHNAIDKEAGVYAMYAYDTLYMLTKDAKWLECLKQATAFTMSTVVTLSFSIQDSDLKSAYPVENGYTDGMSFITCTGHGVDNYISFIYYELFRIYLLTGDESYLKQAEFIQQNTKSIMNWDGALGYKYKSLVAEASEICNFTYRSADDGVWLPWSSVANAEPIAKMYANFGVADVMVLTELYSLDELQTKLYDEIGIGGQYHNIYDSKILDQVE